MSIAIVATSNVQPKQGIAWSQTVISRSNELYFDVRDFMCIRRVWLARRVVRMKGRAGSSLAQLRVYGAKL